MSTDSFHFLLLNLFCDSLGLEHQAVHKVKMGMILPRSHAIQLGLK